MHSTKLLRAGVLLSLAGSLTFGQTNVLTWHNDRLRSGANLSEPILTPANVSSSTFGKLYEVMMDGKVDAQPLYVSAISIPGNAGVHNVVYAATEHDSVYAFDADTGTVYWKVSVLGTGETPSDNRACGQITPEIGVTSTPVIDLSAGPHGAIYLVAMSKDASGAYYQRVHALDITTGVAEFGGPVAVQATYPGAGANSQNGTVIFDPKQHKDRAGLLLVQGNLITSWGSHCDRDPYSGWLIAYDSRTLQQTGVFNFAPNGREAGIWNAGGGPAADAQGNLFYSVANGTFDTNMTPQGFPASANYGNSFIKLTATAGKFAAADYWTMYNTVSESTHDADLGSGGLMLLPDLQNATGKTVRLGLGAGKDNNLYVIDRDNMGKYDPESNGSIYQVLNMALPGGIFSSPAYYNGNIYFGAVGDNIRAFTVNDARLSNLPSSVTPHKFAYPGATPSISANNSADGILWALENSTPAVLHAYDATDLGKELYKSEGFGPGNKYVVPTIANGKVFIGTPNSVAAFGLLAPQVIPNGTYILTNQASRLVLEGGDDTQPVQSYLRGGASQKWVMVADTNGNYTIRNSASGLYLTDPGSSASRASDLRQQVRRTAGGADPQLWTVKASGSGYLVTNQATGLRINDPNFDQDRATGIILSPPRHGSSQVWTIQEYQGAVK